jgi:hypothetical protein
MALVTQTIPALYGGVSQQSPVQRSPAQCQEAVNCSFSVSDGVSKRPPLEVINELTTSDLSGAFFHWITDRNNDKYLAIIYADGDLDVYRLSDGQKLVVLNDTANPYLICTNPVNEIKAYTVEENTYFVNSTITVDAAAAVTPGSIAGTVQTLQDTLLDSASEGDIYKIIGDTDNKFDSYYVKKVSGKWFEWVSPGIQYQLDNTTMPHRLELIFDVIDPNGVRFEFLPVTWGERTVGDDGSNKFPSFVGNLITGIFFTSDRLSFLSSSSIVMSETDEHHNFFRTTITDVLATARIDIKETSDDATAFFYAKPLGDNIMLFSENRQSALSGDPFISPQTVGITLATNYRSSSICEPQNSGSNLYFPLNSGVSTELRELYVRDDTLMTSAENVSSHVPSYVPKDVRLLAVQNNLDFIAMYSDDTPDKLWINQYKYQGQQKVQSSWSHWLFDEGIRILDIETIEHYLYVVYTYTKIDIGLTETTSTYIGRINLKTQDPGIATGFSHQINLDLLQKITGSYDGGSDTTSFSTVSPYLVESLKNKLVLLKGDGWADKGRYVTNGTPDPFVRLASDNQFSITGDWTTGDVWIGIPYNQEFTFSELQYRDNQGVNIAVRNQVREMSVSFTDTPYFKTEVDRIGRDPDIAEVIPDMFSSYTSRSLGNEYFTLNNPVLATATYTFPILGNSKEVVIKISNDSYMPCNIQSASYKTLISTRLR